ncbi:Hypothetical predicted protein [Octopus vulgaris]|uniref:Uncharacterized protein n=1 Tax=Octopus vulgaris TaxID=6645 RepID=A0AA36BE10_OCTVU|nr:Hypothetical predicted protein [Octopus vulgaris]
MRQTDCIKRDCPSSGEWGDVMTMDELLASSPSLEKRMTAFFNFKAAARFIFGIRVCCGGNSGSGGNRGGASGYSSRSIHAF